MDRREMLLATGALAAVATSAFAADKPMMDGHQHHHQHHPKGAPQQALLESATHCVMAGEICLDHCHDLLSDGDKGMGACAKSVNQMLAVVGALRSLAAQDGTALKAMAKVAFDVCKECEDECRKHEKKHQQCRDCAGACADCAKACRSLLSA